MLTLKVKKERSGPVLGFHPWVFSGALENIPDGTEAGTPVMLVGDRGEYLASGYFNSYSQIAVRIWGHDAKEEVDKDFFLRRVGRALETRRRFLESPLTDSYRLVNGESDHLPGLIVDKYSDVLVAQFHTRGIERWKAEIIEALVEGVSPKGIYERSDAARRTDAEGRGGKGLLFGDVPGLIEIKENGLRFLVDVKEGQKTGFFLDQRDKRQAAMKYAGGRNVLNCFSYTGGFSVYALSGGAERVTMVDTSAAALELSKENIKINGLDLGRCEFVSDDVKSYLRAAQGPFGLLVLDPPAFIKDRRKKAEGMMGYRGINEAAIRLLREGSILVTCSCSAHLTLQEFRYMLSEAGLRAGKPLRMLETYTHGLDHPELVSFTEGEYLKCFIAEAGGP